MNENPTMNKLIGVALTITVAVIMIAAILSPVISEAQKTAGSEVTMSNQIYGAYYMEADSDYTMTISAEGWKVNGIPVIGNFRQAVFADSFVVQLNAPNDATSYGYVIGKGDASPVYLYVAGNAEYTLTFSSGSMEIMKTGAASATYSKTYGWAYAFCASSEDATWGTVARIGTDNAYVLDESQIRQSGYYYTGSNKGFYSYSNGELYVPPEYDGSISLNKELVDGTTDIYSVTEFTVSIGNESFIPYLTLVPLTVTGHSTTGPMVSLYGVIPAMVIVALLGVAASLVRSRME